MLLGGQSGWEGGEGWVEEEWWQGLVGLVGLGGGNGQDQLLLRLPPFQRWTEHAAKQVASSSTTWTIKQPLLLELEGTKRPGPRGEIGKKCGRDIHPGDKDSPGLVGAWSGR